MKNKFKKNLWFALVVIVALGLLGWYLSHVEKNVVEYEEAGDFVTFYDVDTGGLRTVALDPACTKVFVDSNGAKYLLQSECFGESTCIYDSNGSKLNGVLLSGKQIAISNHGDVLIEKVLSENKKQWELSYNYGLVLPETEDKLEDGSSNEYVPVAKIIMWGKSKLAVYDKDENEIYEKFFLGLDLNIEKAIPCGPARVVVFTSECEHPVEYDSNLEKYKTKRRISFVVIDYCRDSNDLQQGINDANLQTIDNFGFNLKDTQQSIYSGIRLISVDEFSDIDITSSQDHKYVGGGKYPL